VYYSDKRPSDKWAGGRADGDGRNIILGRHICIYNWRNQGANEQLSLARAAASGLVSVWLAPLRRQTNRYSERGQGAGSRAAAERHDERRTRAPWGLGPVVPPPSDCALNNRVSRFGGNLLPSLGWSMFNGISVSRASCQSVDPICRLADKHSSPRNEDPESRIWNPTSKNTFGKTCSHAHAHIDTRFASVVMSKEHARPFLALTFSLSFSLTNTYFFSWNLGENPVIY